MIFIDESAANEKSAYHKYGWMSIGKIPHIYSSAKCSECWSILPTYAADGFVAWEIIQGSFNTQLFNEFIHTQVLPQCTPYLSPKSSIVIDNTPIHRSEVLFRY